MKAIVFYYKYPRNQFDLVCEVLEAWMAVRFILCPQGSYIYTDRWWHRVKPGDRADAFVEVQPHQVPKEMRMRALVLT